MQIEDIIYDAAVLKMGVCLERFLKRDLNVTQSDTLSSMISEFFAKRKDKKTRKWMYNIRDARNKAAHSGKVDHSSDKTTDAVFNFESFQKIRRIGLDLDERLRDTTGRDTGMSEIMISSPLPYDMGNAGDLLKHGALATFVDWSLEYGAKQIHYADPFGGRPWDYIFNDETRRRMGKLSSLLRVTDRAQPHWRKNKYYGSSHVVRNIAEARDRVADTFIFASDKDQARRSDLEISGIRPIEDHDPENGFGILDKQFDGFDLILLDPFADFLLNEYGNRRDPTSHFESISKSVERNDRLCVMLFVLDMKPNSIHEQYVQQRNKYSELSFCLRCPKMKNTGVGGEAKYNMEVLLISKRFAERSDSVSELKKRLHELRQALEDTLPSGTERIEFWYPD